MWIKWSEAEFNETCIFSVHIKLPGKRYSLYASLNKGTKQMQLFIESGVNIKIDSILHKITL